MVTGDIKCSTYDNNRRVANIEFTKYKTLSMGDKFFNGLITFLV